MRELQEYSNRDFYTYKLPENEKKYFTYKMDKY